ncbi:MAG: hypothetical protein IPO05_15705 [Flavobacteriales bacterium]|nr:hypothetical protein [Flavobacteriales bacterium]MBK9515034.1 hypothetical protein [Flavobacteriales bacterium]
MKKAGLHTALLLLAALYCLAMGHMVRADSTSVLHGEQSPPTGNTISGPTGLFLHHTSQTEGSVDLFRGPSAAGSKDPVSGSIACTRVHERNERTAFVHQVEASRSLLLALRRAELIFPFHTYW